MAIFPLQQIFGAEKNNQLNSFNVVRGEIEAKEKRWLDLDLY